MITITIIMTIFTVNFVKSEGIEISGNYVYAPIPSNVYYESLTPNSGITQREAINNTWYNLEKDNFKLDNISADLYNVDMTFSKGDEMWRYVYDLDSNYMIFFNKYYEDSFRGESYISEGKENR